MQDISDKELDQFFKKSIEQPELPFEEEAWAKMEQSLEKHDQKQRLRRYSHRALFVLAVYVLSAVSVRTLEKETPLHSSSLSAVEKSNSFSSTASRSPLVREKNTARTTDQKASSLKDTKELSPSSAEQLKEQSIAFPQDQAVEKEHHTVRLPSEARPSRYSVGRKRKENKNKGDEEIAVLAYNQTIHARKHKKGEALVVAKEQQEPIHSLIPEVTTETSGTEITATDPVTILPDPLVLRAAEDQTQTTSLSPAQETTNADHNAHTSAAENSTPTTTTESTVSNDGLTLATDSTQKNIPADSLLPLAAATTKDSTLPKDKAARKRHFSVGIFASPDFSFTASHQFVSPGLSEGFFVEYHHNKRFALFVGLMHSSKIYSSDASDYKATDKYWGYKGYTSRIDGSCAVLDVPINVKYHFYNKDKNLLFAAAGMSSYFMLHQQYSFIYKDGSPERSWEHTKKQNYFFGLVNLSFGYEHYISKSFSVQVEPFIKIPLNTIGLGEVKLLTTGMFVYLKYSIQ